MLILEGSAVDTRWINSCLVWFQSLAYYNKDNAGSLSWDHPTLLLPISQVSTQKSANYYGAARQLVVQNSLARSDEKHIIYKMNTTPIIFANTMNFVTTKSLTLLDSLHNDTAMRHRWLNTRAYSTTQQYRLWILSCLNEASWSFNTLIRKLRLITPLSLTSDAMSGQPQPYGTRLIRSADLQTVVYSTQGR